jgi:hypothetical protein
MLNSNETDPIFGQIFLAGERVHSGIYRQIDGMREVVVKHDGHLPASLDGTVATYYRIHYARDLVHLRLSTHGNESTRPAKDRPGNYACEM